ncbi:unnamed protein product [Symbiodinium natans]|uniref:Uncharacterized protein n=1 Tax=Symbiodinium natans TaxID=878477 RepID=A0A812GDW0_9DINO|nr:unnamed protein product [Symbiodinium natans]
MDACVKAKQLSRAENWLRRLLQQGGSGLSAIPYSILINGYALEGDFASAKGFLREMDRRQLSPDAITYSSLVDAAGKAGAAAEASALFREMQARDLKANIVAYTSLVNAFARQGNVTGAVEVMQQMEEERIHPNTVTYSCAVKACGRAQELDRAWTFLRDMEDQRIEQNIMTWAPVIEAVCKHRNDATVKETLSAMLAARIAPQGLAQRQLEERLGGQNLSSACAEYGLEKRGRAVDIGAFARQNRNVEEKSDATKRRQRQAVARLVPEGCAELIPEAKVTHGPRLAQKLIKGASVNHRGTALRRPGAVQVLAEGVLHLRPWFKATTKGAVVDFYNAAKVWFAQGEDAKARDACEKALKLADELRPPPAEMGDTLHLLGAYHLRAKSFAMAIKCFERAMLVKQMTLAEEDQTASMAATLLALGGAHLQSGAPVTAARCLQTAVATLEELGDDTDELMLASAYQALAGSYRAAGQHGQALQCYNLCLELREAKLGPEDPQLIPVLNNLGAQAQQLLRHKEAADFYRRALSLERKSLGTEHVATATTLANLGTVFAQLSEHGEAVTCLSQAYEIQRAELGENHPTLATTLHNLGNALASCSYGDKAAECLCKALEVWQKAHGETGSAARDIAATLHSLGNVHRGRRDPAAAQQALQGALQIREAALGKEHPDTARTRHCLGLVHVALGERATALQELATAASALRTSLGSKHPWSQQAQVDVEALRTAL